MNKYKWEQNVWLKMNKKYKLNDNFKIIVKYRKFYDEINFHK